MCGIVGLFIKDKALEPRLGELTATMLATMCERGPDSAGFAIYGDAKSGKAKITLQSPQPDTDFAGLAKAVGAKIGHAVTLDIKSTHAVLTCPAADVDAARAAVREVAPNVRVMGRGDVIEIYKEVGWPTDVAKRFDLESMTGTHAIGHTRMATESAVTTLGAHPFSTGPDQCLVHNGSLSNHNNLRRELIRDGMIFETVLIGTLGADAFLGLWTGATSWDDPRVTEALTEYKKILDPANGWINTDHSSLSWDQAADKLIDGTAAMTIMGDWANGEFTAKEFADYGWAPAPGNADIYQALSDSFGLPVKAQHPDETKLFLAWLGSAETQAIFNPYKGSIAANVTSGDPPADELQYNDYQKSAQADWKTNTIVPSMEHGAAANPAWSSAINDVLTSFVTDLDVAAAQGALVTAASDFTQ